MRNRIEMLEKEMDELAEQLFLLKDKPREEIESVFHERITNSLRSLVALAEHIEAEIAGVRS